MREISADEKSIFKPLCALARALALSLSRALALSLSSQDQVLPHSLCWLATHRITAGLALNL